MSGVLSSVKDVKVEDISSSNVEIVIESIKGARGIMINNGKTLTVKNDDNKAQYYLNVEQIAEVHEGAQFLTIQGECADGNTEQQQYVAVQMDGSDQIILQDKDIVIELCRICANGSDRFVPIFNGEGLEHDLQNKIQTYLPLQISEDDSLPLQVCYNCAETLLAWHEIHKGCLNAQDRLVDLQNKFNFKTQCVQDSLVEEDDVIEDEEVLNSEEPEAQSSDTMKEESIQAVNMPESDRCKNCQIRIKQIISTEITNKEQPTIARKIIDTVDEVTNTPLMKKTAALPSDNKDPLDLNTRDSEGQLVTEEIMDQLQTDETFTASTEEAASCPTDEHPFDFSTQNSDSNDESSVAVDIADSLKNEDPNEFVGRTGPFKCTKCNRLFKYRYVLIRHLRIHRDDRPFTCDVCGKGFHFSAGLSRHVKDVHFKIKSFACAICGVSFASKRTREDHLRTHTGERPYVCDACGYCFKSKASLHTHSKLHTDDFPHVCMYCKKGFRRKQELLCHISIHTGEKSFKCSVCHKSFRIKSELNRHSLVHLDAKPFACDACDFRSRQRRYLNNHIRTMHTLIDTRKQP